MKKKFLTALGTLILLLGTHGSAFACAACYGDTTGSRMGNAAQVGIFAMLFLMLAVLGIFGSFFYYLAYRSKHPLPDYHDLLNENESSSPTS